MTRAVASAALGTPASGEAPVTAFRPRRRHGFAAAAVAAGVVVAVGLGGYAYASGQLVSVASAFDDVFGGGTAPTNVTNKVGRPVNAVATSGGITVSADAIMGDERNYVVVYSISRTDGKPLGTVGTDENGTLTLDGRPLSADFDQSVDGATGQGGGAYFYDADPSDNAIQLVTQLTADTNVIGATVNMHLSAINGLDDSAQSQTPVATGSWDLKFKLNYEADSVSLKPAGSLAVAGTDASVQSVSVSPVAVSVDYTVNGTEDAPKTSGRWSPKYLDLGDITVTLRDGTTITVPSGACSSHEEDGRTVVEMGAFLDRTIDPSQVASVSFGGVTATA